MGISISAGSFDSSGLISQLVQIASQPITDLQTKQSNINSAVSTLSTFASRLGTLKTDANLMSTSSSYNAYSATSTDTSVVASTTGSATAGSYSVTVNQLASIEKLRSNTQASSTDALGMSGSLSLQVGTGSAVDIDIASTDSLTDVAAKIAKSGARVTASVLYDGSNYRLALQGMDTGAANAINVTQNGLDLGLNDSANVYQKAQDAKLTVDGLDITRPTNSVSSVIPGVTLALTKPGVTSTVTVNSDTTKLEQNINTFISAYNAIVNAGHTATGYGSTAATNAVLQGDSTIRGSLDKLAGLAGGLIPGTTGKYQTLGSVGIKLGQDGTLSFDSDTFESAIASDPDNVRKLFVTDSQTGATGVMKMFSDAVDSMTLNNDSTINARQTALKTQSSNIDDEITDKQRYVDSYQTQLKAQYSNLDAIMSKYSTMSTAIANIGSTSSG